MNYALRLSSECLLSKYGFNDGDEPDELLDALDQRDLPHPDNWHAALRVLVREHLLPVLDQRVELVNVETNHNPIRAITVDGVDAHRQWRAEDLGIRLTPEWVDVPLDRVIEVIRAVDQEGRSA
jgi:hypothetical protein